MKKYLALAVFAFAATAPAAAQVTLYDQTNLPRQSVTPVNLTFTATDASTTLNFQGYDIPSSITLINLFFNVTGTVRSTANNLLSSTYSYTPAASQPFATTGTPGLYGSTSLIFGGGTVGSYDTFSQTLTTTIGQSYTLGFSLSEASGRNVTPSNGLRITTGALAAVPSVPEPSTWAMMLFGFGAVGVSLRRRRRDHAMLEVA